jgi:intracellular septation protein
MQLLFDFLPLLAFFVAYKLAGIFVATAVIIAAVIIQTIVQWVMHRKVSQMALISGGLVVVFGGLTLWIHDEAFIKWKVTAVYWLLAAGLLVSQFVGDRPFVQRMLGAGFTLERAMWQRLNLVWAAFFLALGALNIYVMHAFSTDVWVKFKVFGVLGLMIAFLILQFIWLWPKVSQENDSTEKSQ